MEEYTREALALLRIATMVVETATRVDAYGEYKEGLEAREQLRANLSMVRQVCSAMEDMLVPPPSREVGPSDLPIEEIPF